jgi:YD repeat-containing protein
MNSVGANGAQDRTTSMTYDNAGRLATSTDAAGTVTSYYYDSANRVSQSMVQGAGQTLATRTVYDALGRVVYTIDPLGDATLNTYDANGNVIAVRRYANAISAANLATLTPTATAANVAALISPDNTNDRIQRSVYDGQNRLVYSIDGVGDVTMNTYDGTGKVVAVRRYASPINLSSYPASPTVSSVAALITANNTYDRITTNVFDADNRLRFVIDPAGYVTETQYDALGQVLETLLYTTPISTATAATVSAVAAAVSNQMSSAHTVSNAYDAAGHLLSTTDARGNTESYQYDALGNKKAFTNKAGNTWTYSYDAQGRQLSETDPSVTLNTVAIDGVGNVNVATPASVNLATINTYDAFGDLTSRTEGVGSSQQRTTSYAYDRLGRQTGTTFPAVASGTPQAAVTYDSLGNATTSQDVGNKYSFKVYDGNGRVLYDIDAAGYITGYVRNAFGEVTQLTRYGRGMSSLGAGPVSLTQVQSFLATANHDDDRVITTQYDAAGRMVKTIEPQGYAWDPAHNLNPTKSSTFTASKATATTYNAFGEMLKQSVFGQDSSGVVQTVSADTFYSYNARGQQIAQIQIQDRQPGATSASGYLTARSYDAAGNVTDEIQYSVQQNFADSAFSTITGALERLAKAGDSVFVRRQQQQTDANAGWHHAQHCLGRFGDEWQRGDQLRL